MTTSMHYRRIEFGPPIPDDGLIFSDIVVVCRKLDNKSIGYLPSGHHDRIKLIDFSALDSETLRRQIYLMSDLYEQRLELTSKYFQMSIGSSTKSIKAKINDVMRQLDEEKETYTMLLKLACTHPIDGYLFHIW